MIEQLSQHIEDRYQELLSAGGSEPEAGSLPDRYRDSSDWSPG
jgi:hypothetical protein